MSPAPGPGPSGVRARIDGVEIAPVPGRSILEAARSVGIEIPSPCASPGLPPEGSCRLCLVELDGAHEPVPACHTPLAPGMAVRTQSGRLFRLRRELLEWIADAAPAAARTPRADGTELERLLHAHGVAARDAPNSIDDARHPYLRLDPARCIACARCVHACDEVQGQRVLALARREEPTRLLVGHGPGFVESDCTSCGACVDVCPTGAISDRDRRDPTPAERSVRSTCAYCGVGCQVEVESARGRVLRIGGVREADVNRGHLCAKGRYGHGYHRSADRLTRPLLRENGALRPVAWDEALGWLVRRIEVIRDRHGADALGALASSRSTNEAAYLLQKLFRTRIGTNNVDCCARVCHASTALALREVTGTGAATASYADIERARCLVVVGANPTEAHPVVGARIVRRARAGTPLVVIDPRRIELVGDARVHLALRPGTNVVLLNGLAKLLVEELGVDDAYVAERLEGLPALRRFLATLSLDTCVRITGVALRDLRAAAAELAAGPALFVHGLGLSELVEGTASVRALCNLGGLTGSIGRPGAGMLPLRGQNNVQGAADMGATPGLVTGEQSIEDPTVREHVARVWGVAPPATRGLTLPEMLDAAVAGRLRALWVQGEDLVRSEPHESHVRAALAKLDLLVVQELFLSETARLAHLVLPAAGALEQEGTFTNGERRIQRVRAAVPPPAGARPDWEVIRDTARALGDAAPFDTPDRVMDEVARVAPRLFGGVAYDRLDGDGLQWPCPSRDHPGTASVHAEGFLRGRGRLSVERHVPSPEHDVDGFPFTLITGRVLQQYNVGSMTGRTAGDALAPEDVLELATGDLRSLGLDDGAWVEVESRWGRTCVRARASDRVQSGSAFLSFHHAETHANALTGPQRDPESNCPEYKITAVRIRAVPGDDPRHALLTAPRPGARSPSPPPTRA